MGLMIVGVAERKVNGRHEGVIDIDPFNWEDSALFAFLADAKESQGIEPIAAPRGLPTDASEASREVFEDEYLYRPLSWVELSELVAFDYERTAGETGCTYRDQLGWRYFEEIERLTSVGVERVVFGFDW